MASAVACRAKKDQLPAWIRPYRSSKGILKCPLRDLIPDEFMERVAARLLRHRSDEAS